ncbi:hypothetical protein ABK040_002670 [Willaertia magna]
MNPKTLLLITLISLVLAVGCLASSTKKKNDQPLLTTVSTKPSSQNVQVTELLEKVNNLQQQIDTITQYFEDFEKNYSSDRKELIDIVKQLMILIKSNKSSKTSEIPKSNENVDPLGILKQPTKEEDTKQSQKSENKQSSKKAKPEDNPSAIDDDAFFSQNK